MTVMSTKYRRVLRDMYVVVVGSTCVGIVKFPGGEALRTRNLHFRRGAQEKAGCFRSFLRSRQFWHCRPHIDVYMATNGLRRFCRLAYCVPGSFSLIAVPVLGTWGMMV